jgi:GT2 family glycosyltransferase
MGSAPPEVSVVVATRDRPHRLEMLLRSLEDQTLDPRRYEVVVVEDGPPRAQTAAVLARAAREAGYSVTAITGAHPHDGRHIAATRNRGWRAARAPLIAFTDDDCSVSPEWLEAGLREAAAAPGAIVQGPTEPLPAERHRQGPFSYTVRTTSLGPHFQTCNIFYPRSVLERLGGFDDATFTTRGEDTDLAWRAIEQGTPCRFAPRARVYHAVEHVGALGRLRRAARLTEAVAPYARSPRMRRHLHRGVFWSYSHYRLLALAVALVLPRRARLLRGWLVWRYADHLLRRCRSEGAGPGLAPFLIVHDVVELAAVLRGAVRYRAPVL